VLPSITWDNDPVALEIPRGPLLLVLGGIAAVMLVTGLAKKQGDVTLFGLMMGAILAVASQFLPDPIGIRWYSLLFVGVFLGGYALLNWQIRRGGGPEEAAGDFIVYGVLGVLVGSRLGHVIFYDLDKALADPLWVFQIWTGGLASHGAVMGLILAMWLFTKRRHVPFLEGADRFAFSAALGATLVRLGNFLNSEIVGREVPDQSWGVRFPRYDVNALEAPLRYPTQLFEVGLGLLVMAGLFIADRALGKEKRPRGALISVFFVLYFIGRFTVEFFKEFQTELDQTSPFTMGQYLSIPGILIGVVGLVWSLKRREPAGWPRIADEEDDEDAEDEDEDEDEEDDAEERDEEPGPGRARKGGGRLYDPDVEEELNAPKDRTAPRDDE
jgi:prolipoprotein diacylglyceryl transferase